MVDAAERARAAANLVERIGARVPGFRGYLERELRREVDQTLRAQLAARLDRARADVAAHTRKLGLAAAARLDRLSTLDKRLDGLANTVRHAGSGYAGLFDATKVRIEELEALYRFDLSLLDAVDAVVAGAARLGAADEELAVLEAAVAALGDRIAGRDAVIRDAFGA